MNKLHFCAGRAHELVREKDILLFHDYHLFLIANLFFSFKECLSYTHLLYLLTKTWFIYSEAHKS